MIAIASRGVALNDEAATEATLGTLLGDHNASGLDAKTHALVRVAALIAAESAQASHSWAVEAAMATGASDDDIVDVLAAVAPIVGLARLSTRGTPARPRPRPRLDADATQPRWRPERTKHGWTTRGPEGETSRTEAMRDGSVISASV